MRWHKYIGYIAGTFFLIHPVLMIARRFWVEESNPIHNLMLMIKSPLMLTGILAWLLLVLIITMALIRKKIPPKLFRLLHGALSLAFTALATCHVISIGLHSNSTMNAYWVLLAGFATIALLSSYLEPFIKATKGAEHESA